MKRASLLTIALFLSSCGAASAPAVAPAVSPPQATETPVQPEQHVERVSPPPSGPANDLHMPAIARTKLTNELELNTVASHALPIVYVRLVIKSGGASDPAALQGLSHLVASLMSEGTKTRSAAKLADDVEFLGADLSIGSDDETLVIDMHALKEKLPELMNILADVTLHPAFSDAELTKLKKRELDRLALRAKDPGFLASREFYKALYGNHPYAHVDTTKEVVEHVHRADFVNWHKKHFLPNNAFLTVVGDVTPEQVQAESQRVFASWHKGHVEEPTYPAIPTRTSRQIVLVDRPESVQSVIYIGNVAIARNDADWVKLEVANQVLGGSAASRLFMDLRERRSLTYGAYSNVVDMPQPGPFRASASVRNEVTAEALSAFVEHVERIGREAVPENELHEAERYLSDNFPLRIETAGKIAGLVSNLRIYGLPDNYWDTYRTQIRGVTSAEALDVAHRYIQSDRAVFVVVGRASAVLEPLRHYGPVTVVDMDGHTLSTHEAISPSGS